jgi:hypothetical protein
VSERDDGPLLAGAVKVVDEGHMLCQEGIRCDVERMLKQNEGGELGRVDEVGDRRRGRGRR